MAASGAWVGTMGAGGGICDSARAELRRPGFSARGAIISGAFSAGRTVAGTAGTTGGDAGFLSFAELGTGAATLAVFAGTTITLATLTGWAAFAGGLTAVLMFFLIMGLAAGAGFFAGLFATGLAFAETGLARVLDGVTFLADAREAGWGAGFFAVADLTGALAFAATALVFTAGLARVVATVLDFLACTFNRCLLWEPPLDEARRQCLMSLLTGLSGYLAWRAIVAARQSTATPCVQTVGESRQT